MLVGVPAALIEIGIFKGFSKLNLDPFLISILYLFVGVALVEEVLKYWVVREKVISDPEFDEPVDAMLYMIIAALGFASLENLLILWPAQKPFFLLETLTISSFRFVGATFLHALCSAMVGYFLALSFFESKDRIKLLMIGLGIAIVLHGFYNFSIIMIEGNLRFIIPTIILIGLAIAVSLGFKRLKKLASVCKIN